MSDEATGPSSHRPGGRDMKNQGAQREVDGIRAGKRYGCLGAHCNEMPATCIGRYEAMEKDEPACDDCCGHGNEDGYCRQLYPDDDEQDDAVFS